MMNEERIDIDTLETFLSEMKAKTETDLNRMAETECYFAYSTYEGRGEDLDEDEDPADYEEVDKNPVNSPFAMSA